MNGSHVELREVSDDDLVIFFAHQSDSGASWMAAVASRAAPEFRAHWARIRADPDVLIRTIVADGEVAGNVLSFRRDGRREVGYWLGRDYWGKGIATLALRAFIREDRERPLYAKVAGDNTGSIRVLEKCGFTRVAAYKVDDVRAEEFEELLMILE